MFADILAMLKNLNTSNNNFPPAVLYNEGWMLRLILNEFGKNKYAHELSYDGTRFKWYSEALLPSFFKARVRGDKLAESWTHADGIIGDFIFEDYKKEGVKIRKDCRYLVVTEAKMFSRLSSGIKNSATYNQAARNIACMANLFYSSGADFHNLEKLAFYILLPEEQIDNEPTFKKLIDKNNLTSVINERVDSYKPDISIKRWLNNNLDDFISTVDIKLLSWESLVTAAGNESLKQFYRDCLKFNSKLYRQPAVSPSPVP